MNLRARRLCWGCLVISPFVISSCQTPDAVSKFAQQASLDVAKGPAVFNDLTDSCNRRVQGDAPITPAWNDPPGSASIAQGCLKYADDAKSLNADSDVLKNYFDALHQVAAFGTTSADKSGGGGSSGSSSKKATPEAAKNLQYGSSLASLTGKLLTEHYQRSHLRQIVRDADPAVTAIADALAHTAEKQYSEELQLEQEDLTDHFIAFQNVSSAKNDPALYLLNYVYRNQIADITARRHSEEAYVAAMQKIRDGYHELATGNDKLGLKDLEAEADRYSSELQELGSQIAKKF